MNRNLAILIALTVAFSCKKKPSVTSPYQEQPTQNSYGPNATASVSPSGSSISNEAAIAPILGAYAGITHYSRYTQGGNNVDTTYLDTLIVVYIGNDEILVTNSQETPVFNFIFNGTYHYQYHNSFNIHQYLTFYVSNDSLAYDHISGGMGYSANKDFNGTKI